MFVSGNTCQSRKSKRWSAICELVTSIASHTPRLMLITCQKCILVRNGRRDISGHLCLLLLPADMICIYISHSAHRRDRFMLSCRNLYPKGLLAPGTRAFRYIELSRNRDICARIAWLLAKKRLPRFVAWSRLAICTHHARRTQTMLKQ